MACNTDSALVRLDRLCGRAVCVGRISAAHIGSEQQQCTTVLTGEERVSGAPQGAVSDRLRRRRDDLVP